MTIQEAAKTLQSSSYDVGGRPLPLEKYLSWRLGSIAQNYAEDFSNIDVLNSRLSEATKRGENFQEAFDSAIEDINFSNVARLSLVTSMAIFAAAGKSLETHQLTDILDAVQSGCRYYGEKAESFAKQVPQLMQTLDGAAINSKSTPDLKSWREMAVFLQRQSIDNAAADKKDSGLTTTDKLFEEAVSALLKEVSPEMALPKRPPSFANRHAQKAAPKPDYKTAREIAADILSSKVIFHDEEMPAVKFLEEMLVQSVADDNENIIPITQYLRGKGPKPEGMDETLIQQLAGSVAEALGISMEQIRQMDEKELIKNFKNVLVGVSSDTNTLVNEISGLLQTIADSRPDSIIPEDLKIKIYQATASISGVDFVGNKNLKSQKLIREKFEALNTALNPTHSPHR